MGELSFNLESLSEFRTVLVKGDGEPIETGIEWPLKSEINDLVKTRTKTDCQVKGMKKWNMRTRVHKHQSDHPIII
jgi:hypothetical protein